MSSVVGFKPSLPLKHPMKPTSPHFGGGKWLKRGEPTFERIPGHITGDRVDSNVGHFLKIDLDPEDAKRLDISPRLTDRVDSTVYHAVIKSCDKIIPIAVQVKKAKVYCGGLFKHVLQREVKVDEAFILKTKYPEANSSNEIFHQLADRNFPHTDYFQGKHFLPSPSGDQNHGPALPILPGDE